MYEIARIDESVISNDINPNFFPLTSSAGRDLKSWADSGLQDHMVTVEAITKLTQLFSSFREVIHKRNLIPRVFRSSVAWVVLVE